MEGKSECTESIDVFDNIETRCVTIAFERLGVCSICFHTDWPLAIGCPQPTHLLSTNTIYYLVPYYYRVRYDIVFTLIVFGVALNLPEFSVLHDRYDDQHITEYGS